MTLLLPMSAFRLNTEGVTNNEMKLDDRLHGYIFYRTRFSILAGRTDGQILPSFGVVWVTVIESWIA